MKWYSILYREATHAEVYTETCDVMKLQKAIQKTKTVLPEGEGVGRRHDKWRQGPRINFHYIWFIFLIMYSVNILVINKEWKLLVTNFKERIWLERDAKTVPNYIDSILFIKLNGEHILFYYSLYLLHVWNILFYNEALAFKAIASANDLRLVFQSLLYPVYVSSLFLTFLTFLNF